MRGQGRRKLFANLCFYRCSKQISSFKQSLQTVETLKPLSGTTNKQINTALNKSNSCHFENRLDSNAVVKNSWLTYFQIALQIAMAIWSPACLLKLASRYTSTVLTKESTSPFLPISKRFNLLNLLMQQNTPSCFKRQWLPQSTKMVCYNLQQLVFYYSVLSAMKSTVCHHILSFSVRTILPGERRYLCLSVCCVEK